jgi:hypothetical protein
MMRIFFLNLAMLLIVGCSDGSVQNSPEAEFWRWFQANETRLFDFESDRERVFDELQARLHKVKAGLTFEFGPKKNGARDFVISADGIKDVFPSVILLANAAPSLPRWKIIKFRPRRGLGPISLNGLRLSPEQVDFTIERDGPKIGITLFMDGYKESEHERYAGVGFLMLDHALGEYDVETKVGFIEFKPRTAKSTLTKQRFSSLVRSFDEFAKTQ